MRSVYGHWSLGSMKAPIFNAQMSHRSSGGLQVVECLVDPCEGSRSRAEMAMDKEDTFTIQLVLAGKEVFTIDNNQYLLSAGDIVVWNSMFPVRYEITERLQKISATMPLQRLRSWLPDSWYASQGSLPSHLLSMQYFRLFFESVSREFLSGNITPGECLIEAMIAMLLTTEYRRKSIARASDESRKAQAIITFLEKNLSNPDLSPKNLAAQQNCSVRYVHKAFESRSLTAEKYIIEQRLLRCLRDLGNPKMAQRSITEIAFAWGFKSSSHFSRCFKDKFGVSPRDYRRSVNGGRILEPDPKLS
ncbi:helix-turn-helix domain-containing protein [Sphingopyxis indica]|nr:helix-turn-helix domain-containing protein [Sphingopyxis indica]